MPAISLFHVAIKTARPEATRRFYLAWFSDKPNASVTSVQGSEVLGGRVGDFHVSVELRQVANDPGDAGGMEPRLCQ